MKSSDYQLYADGRFVVHHYNEKKPFSNFLPGIAGLYGTPMWVFTVNRGQGIASFGIKNKDNAILEFFPANKAYQMVTTLGFRTFIKRVRGGKVSFYEPFQNGTHQTMEVSSHELALSDVDKAQQLQVSVRYFTIPGEPLAVLARELNVTNLGSDNADLEIIDGLPSFNPYGMNEFFIKNMSRTIEAWMIVENLREKKAPFCRLKVDATDRPEVIPILGGNFYFSFVEERSGPRLLEPIVDAQTIFGEILDFSLPKVFYESTPFKVPAHQIMENKTPSAFSFAPLHIPARKSKTIRSFYGHAESLELLNRYVTHSTKKGYFEAKREENHRLIDSLKAPIFTATASPAYDLYCGQTYLDNLMRGGVPVHIGGRKKPLILYAYSRKHGDLERDYNRFLIEPTYFSQGDGNYRDVNQNRRNDVWFDPKVGDVNLKTFLNLIQLDGFNPLVIKGCRFYLKQSKESKKILLRALGAKTVAACEALLGEAIHVGELYRFLEREKAITRPRFHQMLEELAPFLSREEKAEHQEGFWVDHWTYNLDLVESFLAIYPEEHQRILFDTKEFTFFDSAHVVRPRAEKYCLKEDGQVRQYQAVFHDLEKKNLLDQRKRAVSVVRSRFGRGEVYQTTLFVKLLCLFANKLASLDPQGVGVEMEADKPSWLDALNGLPGLLGSSLPEAFELKRLALFLIQSIEDRQERSSTDAWMPVELWEFVKRLSLLLEDAFSMKPASARNFVFWDGSNKAKERFRAQTRLGVSGKERKMSFTALKIFLEHAREKIEIGLDRAFDSRLKIFPTYFENEVTSFRTVSVAKRGGRRQKEIVPLAFKQKPLPLFLEGPVHALKVEKDPQHRKELLKAVRESGLYDTKLGMYKVNADLSDVSLEIGRARVFSPGWLENESIWLHMEYKFLLEVLKGNLMEEFFKDFRKALIPFQPEERYGRSLLENSSFIVSSAFKDPSLHGTGFVARLSGSTAEFLTMWLLMNVGKKPFVLGPDKKLSLRFEPRLPEFLFVRQELEKKFIDKNGEQRVVKIPKNSLAFMFLGKTLVFYHNPKRLNTFGQTHVSVKKICLQNTRGQSIEFRGDTVPSPYAARVRDEWVPRIDIELG